MLNFLICFFTLDIIRKNFNTERYFRGNIDTIKVLHLFVVPGLLLIDLVFKKYLSVLPEFSWVVILTYQFYVLYENKENALAASLIKAGLPYYFYSLALILTKNTLPGLYKKYDDYFDLVGLAVIIWLIAFGIGAKNQLKNLKKEKEEKEKVISENETLESMVRERTQEILLQKNQLEETLEELKQTQDQLIQQEKLASLGELTAGIAHEIQNPLNFVNNFSEVSIELIDELKEELQKNSLSEDSSDIIDDIIQNLQKISHHGKRASGIVKNMLEHSRASTGEKQLIDLNALAEEYLKLSYHGLRAKDKSFNSDFKMKFDEQLPQIEAIPQDLGRVLLNLFNNAFYAVQKKAQADNTPVDYKPLVTVCTERKSDELIITVADNGLGIPEDIKSKIFQPFFTTKPTGQGTGLGLSLSYDIVTKGHAGELEVDSTEGEGSTFIITLPLDNA
jgi:two-component system NtrC family sensor kinase